MGLIEKTKHNLNEFSEDVRHNIAETKDKVDDWVDEKRAEKDVKAAEAKLDATQTRNDIKDEFRT